MIRASIHRLVTHLAPMLLALGTALPIGAQIHHPVQWTLTASAQGARPLHRGQAVVARLHAQIQRGWHLYASGQEPGGPTALRISVPERQPFAIHGDISAPTPDTAIDPNLNVETRFYEDSVTFTIPLKVNSRHVNGIRKIFIDVLYQVCNQVMCLEPTVSHLTSQLKQ